MTVRTITPVRMAALVPGFAFLALTGYLALMAAVRPETAPSAPQSLASLRKLPRGELNEVLLSARAAFSRDPLDAGSVVQLSRVIEASGNEEAAQRLRLIAGDMRPRDTRIQAEALAILIQRRDFEAAMTSLDGLIRVRPNRASTFLAVAAEIAAEPEGRSAVAAKLAEQPPWREQFIAETIRSGKPRLAQQVMSDLRAMGTVLSTAELAHLISHYLKAGEMDAAYGAWLSSLSPDELGRVKLVYDGGFAGEVRGLGFDWTIRPAKGLSYRLFPRNTASMDMSLQFDFVEVRERFAHLSQILRLRTGRYRIAGEARGESIQPITEFHFIIHCLAAGQRTILAETSPLPQSSQWIQFESTFTVPPTGCGDQVLSLESRKSAGPEKISRGRLALDAIVIERLTDIAP